MDKQNVVVRLRIGLKIFLWIALLAFFVYSFLTIMDFEPLRDPKRWEFFKKLLSMLTTPVFDKDLLSKVAIRMLTTIQMAFLATVISAIIAIPFGLFCAKPSSALGRVLNIVLQIMLAVVRSIHPLILTILLVVVIWFGSTTGVLALTFYSTAVLIGLFSDFSLEHPTIKRADRFRVYYPALAFKHFPVNLLITTILGFMGGGGIGLMLAQNLNLLEYDQVGTILLTFILVIGGLDLLARAVWRHQLKKLPAYLAESESTKLDDPVSNSG